MARNKHRVVPDKEYKVTFGVVQTEKINKAVNKVNETPKEFIKKSSLDTAKKISG